MNRNDSRTQKQLKQRNEISLRFIRADASQCCFSIDMTYGLTLDAGL
ncbi:hypothetical protein [Vibrio genomosp. F10]|nr:hypothetical protein [Vibrio genomosp. F10]